MPQEERRRSERKSEVFPVSVAVDESPTLEGSSVNFSSQGVLLMARGSLQLLVTIKGKQYRSRLVRAFPTEDGLTAYAVELDDPIEAAEPPARERVPAAV